MRTFFIPRWLLVVAFTFIFSGQLNAQTLTVTLVGAPDTTGFSVLEQLALEREVMLELSSMGGGSDTLVVEMGTEAGNNTMFLREFALGTTGSFEDGCSLSNTAGLTVGLGRFTGISDFYVRAYLKAAGVGSAISLHN
ncbi:MAG: hypothetical protein K9G46_07305 [Flavobacteriales bacterium]|nr:hypothetical protein [Flavobacteriales bacterium]